MKLPIPIIKPRSIDPQLEQAAIAQGLHPMIAKILATRSIEISSLPEILNPKISLLEHPEKMQDMQVAAKRLATAIINKECIGLETDHDCDGQTSHAVLYHVLVNKFFHPKNLIKSYIGHRLTEGYGLSQAVAQRILQDHPKISLLITADNGSSDEARIALLKSAQIDVIVTDHHQIPVTGGPKSAIAFLNPTREDCEYDPYIAGCMVAWLLMASTRLELIQQNYLPKDAPKLQDTLDYVAVGTVADCVSFAKSTTNRIVVKYGLELINKKLRPCWQAVLKLISQKITAEDLAFKIAPLLNSDGRLSDAFGSVSFLLAENSEQAFNWLEHLQQQNKERREIQKIITYQGLANAKQQVLQNCYSLCIFLPDGHPGVHGIAASRIKERFGRPTAFFAPKVTEPEVITGSLRGVENFHVRDALQFVADSNPDLFIAFGGHRGAGGASLKIKDFEQFAELFEQAARKQLTEDHLGPVIWSDGILDAKFINLDFLNQLKILEPFGREFESPIFDAIATIKTLKTIGDGTHARCELIINNQLFTGVWFNMLENQQQGCLFKNGDQVKCAFSLMENNFNNKSKCELQIIGLEIVETAESEACLI